jgi:hypothetical protein
LNSFEEEVKEAWKAFAANTAETHKGDVEVMNGGIDVASLEKTITDSKWETAA